jgi:probable phosphoglycerate mutase
MDRPSLLVLVRHAESVRNRIKGRNAFIEMEGIFVDGKEARKLLDGIPDKEIPLTKKGLKQARKTGISLRKKYGIFHYIYHSGFRRTIETAAGLLSAYTEEERRRMKVEMNPFIYERHAGYTYNMTTADAEKHFPWLQPYWRMFGGYFAQPPGGESLAQVTIRVKLFLEMMFRETCGQKVLVVLHGGSLRCVRFLLEHWDFDRARAWPPGQSPENCGVTVYEYDPAEGRMILKEYNTVYWQ